jgi:membrane protease YdiL (CAAX protease family)
MLVFIMIFLSWAFLLLSYFFQIPHLAVVFIYPWIPGIVALVEAKRKGISLSLSKDRENGWKLAFLFPFLIWIAAFLVSVPFGELAIPLVIQKIFSGGMNPFVVWLVALVLASMGAFLGAALGLISNLGKEFFWRGVLFEKWKEKGWWKGSLMIGFFSGVWFLPFYLYSSWKIPAFTPSGAIAILPYYLLLAPIFQFIRMRSQSVLPVAFFQGLLDTLNGCILFSFIQPNLSLVGMTGIAGLIVLVGFNACLYLYLSNGESLKGIFLQK